jgi:hypothetical protein
MSFPKNTLRPVALAVVAMVCLHSQAQEMEKQLPITHVQAERLQSTAGQTVYNRDTLRATPGGNGDIGSALVRHGSVQFDDAQLSADTAGDIAPANISIHGAKFYDNQFVLDGASMSSTISGGVKSPGTVTDTPDAEHAQGLAIDTSMLCKLTVLDSNIGADYGRFVGGVVEAEVCAPRKQFGGGISLEHTSSKWTERKNGDNSLSTDASKQQDFDKWTLRSNFEAQVSDRVGLVGSFSRKQSSIPLRAYKSGYESSTDANEKNVEHQIDNYYLKGFFDLGRGAKADASVAYAPSTSDMFVADHKDSGYQNRSGGVTATAGLSHWVGTSQLRHRLSWRSLESSKISDQDDKKFWRRNAEKMWAKGATVQEGGTGDVEQTENVLGYKLDVDLMERKIAGAVNKLKVGAEYEHNNFSYSRESQHYNYLTSINTSAIPGVALNYTTTTCMTAAGTLDTELCSMDGAKGQFQNLRNKYRVGSFDYRADYFALYAQNETRWEQWTVNLGLRAERFSDAEEMTWAPRFNAAYQTQQGGLLSVGLNRYYGQTLKMYRIYDKKSALNSGYEYRRVDSNGLLSDWSSVADQAVPTEYASLRTPYADEISLGYAQTWGNGLWKFKYVHRAGEDEVGRHGSGIQWANVGRSRANTYSIDVETVEPLQFKSTSTHLAAVFDYSTRRTNIADWNETNAHGTLGHDLQVWYGGDLIMKYDLPADNYRRPWTLRLMSSTTFKDSGVRVDGIVRLRRSYQKQMEAGTGDGGYKIWQSVDMPKTVNFDLRVSKVWALSQGRSLNAELTLENVFNRSNANGYDSNGYLFEKGRQATVRVGYQF